MNLQQNNAAKSVSIVRKNLRRSAMPDCHKCPHNGNPTSACITCKGPSLHPSNHGLRFVSLEHMPPKELAKLVIPDPEPENPMAEFMRKWVRLPSTTRDMVAHVLEDSSASWAGIARKLKVSRQDVSQNLLKVARQHPELRSVLRLRSRSLRGRIMNP